jgi:pimeloyl-ACP methyl ester carboxylesterase
LLLCASCIFASDPASRFAPFEGGRVHYESYGEGTEALVFIHGWTCDLTFWRGQAPVYTAHRSLLIDLPGHGQSGKPQIPYPTELFARGIAAAMRDAGIERAVLIGHSLGGPIAHAFLRLYPEKVAAIVLVDAYITPPSAPLKNPRLQAQRAKAQLAQLSQRAANLKGPAGDQNFRGSVERMFSDRTSPELRNQIRSAMLATPDYVRAAAVTSVSRLAPLPLDTKYNVPAIAIQAASRGVDARYEAMHKMFPRLELEKWERSGHFLMMEDPDRFNSSLERFLMSLPQATPPAPIVP